METPVSNEPSKEVIEDTSHYQEIGRFTAHFDEAFPELTVSGETPDGADVKFIFAPSEILELAEFVARNQAVIDRVRDREAEWLEHDDRAVKIYTGQGPEPIPTNKSVLRRPSQDQQQ